MAEPALQIPMSRSDFLAWEACQEFKHEFWQGEIVAKTGVRQVHAIVVGNVAVLLRTHLRGKPCRAYVADMQLEVAEADAIFYPDVFVSCDAEDLAAERTLHKPAVVIEVLSKSTAAYDRGIKFAAYRQLPSLAEYVLVDPDRHTVEIFRRTTGGDWLLAVQDGERGLILPSLDFSAGLDAVFEDVPPPERSVAIAPRPPAAE